MSPPAIRESSEPLSFPQEDEEYHLAMMAAMEDGVDDDVAEEEAGGEVIEIDTTTWGLAARQQRGDRQNENEEEALAGEVIEIDTTTWGFAAARQRGQQQDRESSDPLVMPQDDDEEEYHREMMAAMEDGVPGDDEDDDDGAWESINQRTTTTTAATTNSGTSTGGSSAPARREQPQQERESAEPLNMPDDEEEDYHMAMMAAMEDGVPGEGFESDDEEEEGGGGGEEVTMMEAEDNSEESVANANNQLLRRDDDDDVRMREQERERERGEDERDEECRDDNDAMERDSPIPGASSIIPEPLKRLYGTIGNFFVPVDHRDDEEPDTDDDDDDGGTGEPRNKRRRTAMETADDSIRDGFFDLVPTMEEQTQNLMEYSLPITLPCMFKGLQFTSFAQYWCYIIVIGHTIETMISDFGPNTMKLRLPVAFIQPLYHHLCDCFWLHTFITTMFVLPNKFGDNTTKVFWMALGLVQTLPIYLAVSFKTHYLKHQHKLKRRSQKRIERRLIDVAWFYSSATFFLLLSHVASARWCLWIGLTLWNIAPIYLTFSYKKRYEHGLMTKHKQTQRQTQQQEEQEEPEMQKQQEEDKQQQLWKKESQPLLLTPAKDHEGVKTTTITNYNSTAVQE